MRRLVGGQRPRLVNWIRLRRSKKSRLTHLNLLLTWLETPPSQLKSQCRKSKTAIKRLLHSLMKLGITVALRWELLKLPRLHKRKGVRALRSNPLLWMTIALRLWTSSFLLISTFHQRTKILILIKRVLSRFARSCFIRSITISSKLMRNWLLPNSNSRSTLKHRRGALQVRWKKSMPSCSLCMVILKLSSNAILEKELIRTWRSKNCLKWPTKHLIVMIRWLNQSVLMQRCLLVC